jgi:hypothetical protein
MGSTTTAIKAGRDVDIGRGQVPYEVWNLALAQFFYKPAHAGQPVYLQVDSESLRLIGAIVGLEPDECEGAFEQAVQAKLNPKSKANPFAELLRQTNRWRHQVKSDCSAKAE